ncbi:ATP-binding cassette domain-containing protein [Streptomyces sp. NPDC002659]|uniref:ATP-binding cassette domain-containing protein n=1 Tax=Streptomyces sp. NPDC002659 TaxID=3364656 RepID=UPI0036B2A09F
MSDGATSRDGWRMLAREMAKQRSPLLRVGGWSLLESLPDLLSGLLVATALDDGFLAHRPVVGLGWLALLALSLIIKAVATRMTFPWLCATIEPLRDSLVRSLVTGTLQRAVATARRPDTSSVAQLTSQVEMTRQLVSALIRTLRPLVFSLVAAIVGMATLASIIPMFVLPPLVAALVLFGLTLPSLSRRRRDVVMTGETIAKEAGVVLAGIRDVIACGAEERAATDVGAVIDAQARAMRAAAWAGSTRIAVIALGYYIPMITLLLAGPWLINDAWITTGQLIGAMTYLTINIQPALNSIVGSIGGWALQLGTVLQRLHEACTPPLHSPRSGELIPRGTELQISELTFSYGAAADPVIRDLNVTVSEGEHLAIVGPSGIGKSTLASLMIGSQTGQSGEITIGGIPLNLISAPLLHQQITLIPQEAYIFSGTLRENITYMQPEATTEDLDRCSGVIGLRSLVERLGGYEAVIGGEGVTLSDGERQLIALARVYLSPARIVVLDEATCHLDPSAEAQAESAFAARDGSLIVIAHRISSAQRADRVLLLDGVRTRLDTHHRLLDVSPAYADLFGNWVTGVVSRQPS